MLTAIEFPNPYIFFLEVREDKLLSPAELHRFHSMRMTANWIDEHCAIFPYIVQLRHSYFHIQTAEAVKYGPLYLLRLYDCALHIFEILAFHHLYAFLQLHPVKQIVPLPALLPQLPIKVYCPLVSAARSLLVVVRYLVSFRQFQPLLPPVMYE